MAYSYGGWQDEFKGLTKENKFSGSAFEDNTDDKEEVFRPTKRPTGLGTKVADNTSDDGEDSSNNETDVYAVVEQMLGGEDFSAPKATNLTTEKNTELYLAQQDNKIKKQLSFLKKINNINIQKDILNVDENEPVDVSIFRAITAGSNITTDASITSTLPNGDKLTIKDNARARNGAGRTILSNINVEPVFEETVSGLQDFLIPKSTNVYTSSKTITEEFPGQSLLTPEIIDFNAPDAKEFSGSKPSVIEVLKEMYRQVRTPTDKLNEVDPEVKTFGPALADEDTTKRLGTVIGEFRKNLDFKAGLAAKPTENTKLNRVGIDVIPNLSASKPSVTYTSPNPEAVISAAGLGYNAATDTANLSAAGNIGGFNYAGAVDNKGEFGVQINRHLDSFNKPIIYGGFDTDQDNTKFNIGLEWSLGGK
tara:strand:- start:112 stop:1377 length:1266 start_codon:yes stop_codon:yes gene_type:complete